MVTLGWVSFLTDVSSEMIYPLLPNFLTRTLRGGPTALGLIEGVAEATASLAKLLSGWWSDRTRRRKPLVVFGYALAAVARPLVGLATAWTQVLAIRFADRMGKGIRTAPRDALLGDLAPARGRGRAFGLQRSMDNAGAVVGPLLAAFLLRYVVSEERVVFLLAFIPAVAGLVLLIARVPDVAPTSPPHPKVPRDASPLPRRLLALVGVYALFSLAFAREAFLLLRAQDAGIALWQLPLLWAYVSGVKAVVGVPAGTLADRIGRVPVLCMGWAIVVVAYLGFAFASTPRTIWILFGFYAVAPAMAEPAERSLLTDLTRPEQRGRAFGLFHAAIGIASLPAALLFGLWWKLFGAPTAFGISAALASAATVALLVWNSRRKSERSAQEST
ncbi:MAG: MFS transporter [Thermoanaerobaculia bacterium]